LVQEEALPYQLTVVFFFDLDEFLLFLADAGQDREDRMLGFVAEERGHQIVDDLGELGFALLIYDAVSEGTRALVVKHFQVLTLFVPKVIKRDLFSWKMIWERFLGVNR